MSMEGKDAQTGDWYRNDSSVVHGRCVCMAGRCHDLEIGIRESAWCCEELLTDSEGRLRRLGAMVPAGLCLALPSVLQM
jgi:hypothetical protein